MFSEVDWNLGVTLKELGLDLIRGDVE